MIAFISGSGFYQMEGFRSDCVSTAYGDVMLMRGENAYGQPTLFLPRHGEQHRYLPHQINHRAHLCALAECGATSIISLTVCGVIDPLLPLASPFVIEDLYFPDNRLGDGSACTLFTEPGQAGRGHLLAESFFNHELSNAISQVLSGFGQPTQPATYAHVSGPRFNSKVEIKALKNIGADILSQTCGPEAALANELELPYAMVGYGVDYANGVQPEPTPIDVLQQNLASAKTVFSQLIQQLQQPEHCWRFQNFVYRFTE